MFNEIERFSKYFRYGVKVENSLTDSGCEHTIQYFVTLKESIYQYVREKIV